MAKISREVKVGATVFVALFILVWGVNFLKSKDIFMSGYKLKGVYARIDGLTESSPIYYKGFEIGAVRNISLEQSGVGRLVVTMNIEKDVVFPNNTIAQIYSLDLMGSKGIRFLYGNSMELFQEGDTMTTSVSGGLVDQVSQEVLPLKDKAESLVVKLDSVMTNINSLLNIKNKEGISSGLSDFAATMKNLNKISAVLNRSMKPTGSVGSSIANLDSFTLIVKRNGENLEAILNNLKQVSGQLANAHIDSLSLEMNNAVTSLNTVFTSINTKEGTLGLLLKDKKLYRNLNEVSVSLDRLLNDVRHQPKRYVNFSAVNFGGGKSNKKQQSEVIKYKVLLNKTKTPSDLRGKELLEGLIVQEDRDGKFYIYTVGEDVIYDRILQLKESLIHLFPDAQVVALCDDSLVSIRSAE